MVKAIITGGEIRPLEPLPSDWLEGQQLRVEREDRPDVTLDQIDRDFALLDQFCQDSERADEAEFERLLNDSRRQAKEQVRREMGRS